MGRMQLLLQMPLWIVEYSNANYSALNYETNSSPNIPTINILNDSIIIATSTGSSLSILPIEQPNLNITSTLINNIDNNDKDNSNNNNVENFVCQEEVYYTISSEESLLTTEDYEITAST